MEIKIINSSINSKADSAPVHIGTLAGIALGPSHPPVALQEGFRLTIEREPKSPKVIIYGLVEAGYSATRLCFLLRQTTKRTIPCEHLQLELSTTDLQLQTTVNKILKFISPQQVNVAWEIPTPTCYPYRSQPFKNFTNLGIVITKPGKLLANHQRRGKK